MNFLNSFSQEMFATGIVIALIIIFRIIVFRLVKRFARTSQIIEHRVNLVIKYINLQ